MLFPAHSARARRGGSAPPPDPPSISISGTVSIGSVLTATHDGDSVQWYRDSSPISGETADTYTCVAADIDDDVEITCRATNDDGATESNALSFDPDTRFPSSAIGLSTGGATLADSGTTVQSRASLYGGISATVAAPTSTQRPAYSASGGPGGIPMDVYDGADDVLAGTVSWGHTVAAIRIDVVGVLAGAEASADRIAEYSASGALVSMGVSTAPALRLQTSGTGGGTTTGSTTLTGSHRLMTSRAISGASGSQSVAVNGSTEGTSAITHVAWADGGTFSIGARATGANPTALSCLGWAITASASETDPLDSSQRADLLAFFRNKLGIS